MQSVVSMYFLNQGILIIGWVESEHRMASQRWRSVCVGERPARKTELGGRRRQTSVVIVRYRWVIFCCKIFFTLCHVVYELMFI